MKDWKSQVLLKQDKMGMQVSCCHFTEISEKNNLLKNWMLFGLIKKVQATFTHSSR